MKDNQSHNQTTVSRSDIDKGLEIYRFKMEMLGKIKRFIASLESECFESYIRRTEYEKSFLKLFSEMKDE